MTSNEVILSTVLDLGDAGDADAVGGDVLLADPQLLAEVSWRPRARARFPGSGFDLLSSDADGARLGIVSAPPLQWRIPVVPGWARGRATGACCRDRS
jgi:hypothetical protein